jgi:hypothetical protein
MLRDDFWERINRIISYSCIFSFGYFPGVRLSFADVSEPSVRSIFKGLMKMYYYYYYHHHHHLHHHRHRHHQSGLDRPVSASVFVFTKVFEVAFVRLHYNSALLLLSCCCSFLLHVVANFICIFLVNRQLVLLIIIIIISYLI